MSARTDQLRRQAEAAKKDLVGTVGQLGATVNEARNEAIEKAKRYAPAAGAAAAGLIVLRIVTGGGRRRRNGPDD